MNDKVIISIVICNYNNEKYLEKCISSALFQTFPNIEVVCIDDGSTDNSIRIIKKYTGNPRFVFVSHKKNMGLLRTRKDGLNVATGSHVLFLDSDDYLELNACEVLAKILNKSNYDVISFNTNVFCAGCNYDKKDLVNFHNYTRNKCRNGTTLHKKIFSSCYKYNKFTWNLWNKLFRIELLKKAYKMSIEGNFNFGEDMYMFSLILLHCKNIHVSNKYLYNYNFGSGMSTNKVSSQSPTNFISKCKKMILLANAIDSYKKFNKNEDEVIILKQYFKETLTDALETLKSQSSNDDNSCINQISKVLEEIKKIHSDYKVTLD